MANEDILAILPQPEKDNIRNQLTQPQKDMHDALLADINQVKRNSKGRTDLNLETLDSYESMWLKTELEKKEKADELIRQGASAKAVQERTDGIGQQRHAQWESAAKVEFGLAGGFAIQELNAVRKPTGPVGGIGKMFYDKHDGGMQWGGILGALGGLFLGMNFGGMLGGGWMSIVAIIGGVLAGAWLGDKAGDGISSLFSSGEKTPPPTSSQGKSRQADSPEEKSQNAAQQIATPFIGPIPTDLTKTVTGGEHVETEHSAQLPAQSPPAKKAPKQQSQPDSR